MPKSTDQIVQVELKGYGLRLKLLQYAHVREHEQELYTSGWLNEGV